MSIREVADMVERIHLVVANDDVRCAHCGRTLLTGERPAVFCAPGRDACLVCELCRPGAGRGEWSAAAVAWAPSGRLSVAEALSRASSDLPAKA
jgi:hypothetical protein